MNLLDSLSKAMYPGQRVMRVNGWDGLKKFAMPLDSEGIFLDTDPEKDYLYMKRVDSAGNETMARYSYFDDPVEEFDPNKYAKKTDLEDMKEDILNGIDSKLSELLSAITAGSPDARSATGATRRPDGGNQ